MEGQNNNQYTILPAVWPAETWRLLRSEQKSLDCATPPESFEHGCWIYSRAGRPCANFRISNRPPCAGEQSRRRSSFSLGTARKEKTPFKQTSPSWHSRNQIPSIYQRWSKTQRDFAQLDVWAMRLGAAWWNETWALRWLNRVLYNEMEQHFQDIAPKRASNSPQALTCSKPACWGWYSLSRGNSVCGTKWEVYCWVANWSVESTRRGMIASCHLLFELDI